MRTHEQYNGIFHPNDSKFTGHLNISGADSLARLHGKQHQIRPETEYIDIHGLLADGRKVSLLDSLFQGRTQYRSDEYSQSESRYFPHYVVVGEEFIHSNEAVIRAVHYHFENISSLVGGHETFQSLHPEQDSIRRLLEEEHGRRVKIAEKHGHPKPPFEPELHEHPQLFYYSGLWEIIVSDTDLGRLSLTNRTSHDMGSAAGIAINNEVAVNIEFLEPKTVDQTTRALIKLHSLFELSLGSQQRYKWIELELTHPMQDDKLKLNQIAKLYWSLCNNNVRNASRPHPSDVLLATDRRPSDFTKVAAGWMNSAADMDGPRKRFATGFYGPYDINRIVGGANMFDLLPERYAPKRKESDDLLKEAVVQCRKVFKSLPNSSAKQSVLSALGRIGTASLRDKIYHRADKVISVVGDKLPSLDIPCNHAVSARNHYVHGSPESFNYQEHFTQFAFIIDTLEFIFASSDLLDLGWDLHGWMNDAIGGSHPFSVYIRNYEENLNSLKAIIGKYP